MADSEFDSLQPRPMPSGKHITVWAVMWVLAGLAVIGYLGDAIATFVLEGYVAATEPLFRAMVCGLIAAAGSLRRDHRLLEAHVRRLEQERR